jgi:hypothetical protein
VDDKTRTLISWGAAAVGAASLAGILGYLLVALGGSADIGVGARMIALSYHVLLLAGLVLVALALTTDVAPKAARLVAAGCATATGALYALVSLLAGFAVLSELPADQSDRASFLGTTQLLGQGMAVLGGLVAALVIAGIGGLVVARAADIRVGGPGAATEASATGPGWPQPTPHDPQQQPGYGAPKAPAGYPQQQGSQPYQAPQEPAPPGTAAPHDQGWYPPPSTPADPAADPTTAMPRDPGTPPPPPPGS